MRNFEHEMAIAIGGVIEAVKNWYQAAQQEKDAKAYLVHDAWAAFLNVSMERGIAEFMLGKASSQPSSERLTPEAP